MSALELDDQIVQAARREAARRGVPVEQIVETAVRRFVAGADLGDLLSEFRARDAANPDALDEAEAMRLAAAALADVRAELQR